MKPKRYFKSSLGESRIYHLRIVTEGVYFLLKKSEIVYIGRTENIGIRLGGHRNGKKKKDFDRFRIIECLDSEKRKFYETRWLNKFRPKYNKQIPLLVKSESYIERQEFLRWLRKECA